MPPNPCENTTGKVATIERPIGNITMVVAVLLTHMLKNAVTAMIPAIMRRGLAPTSRKTLSASRLSSSQTCMARASKNPPRNRKIRGCA